MSQMDRKRPPSHLGQWEEKVYVIGPANMASSNLIEHKGAAMTRRILTQTI